MRIRREVYVKAKRRDLKKLQLAHGRAESFGWNVIFSDDLISSSAAALRSISKVEQRQRQISGVI